MIRISYTSMVVFISNYFDDSVHVGAPCRLDPSGTEDRKQFRRRCRLYIEVTEDWEEKTDKKTVIACKCAQ